MRGVVMPGLAYFHPGNKCWGHVLENNGSGISPKMDRTSDGNVCLLNSWARHHIHKFTEDTKLVCRHGVVPHQCGVTLKTLNLWYIALLARLGGSDKWSYNLCYLQVAQCMNIRHTAPQRSSGCSWQSLGGSASSPVVSYQNARRVAQTTHSLVFILTACSRLCFIPSQ